MFLHHVATISLITFSYVNNMARVGVLVMCLHDAADVLVEVISSYFFIFILFICCVCVFDNTHNLEWMEKPSSKLCSLCPSDSAFDVTFDLVLEIPYHWSTSLERLRSSWLI